MIDADVFALSSTRSAIIEFSTMANYIRQTVSDLKLLRSLTIASHFIRLFVLYLGCYCTGAPAKCPDLLPGVHNMSDCRFGAPIFASYPHFYLADPSYVDDLIGLKPNQSKHEFSLSLEPLTGIPIDVDAKLQINTMIQPIPGFK